MRVVATIDDAVVIRKILTHLGLRLTCPRLVHRLSLLRKRDARATS